MPEVYRSFDEIRTFHNLIKLKLGFVESNWDLLVQVLNGCPKLQNLKLYEGTRDRTRAYVPKNWVDPKSVPQCLSLHLKTCKFQNFLGQQGELMHVNKILDIFCIMQESYKP
ncbi:F-box/RNI/FBD-like domain protein [Trifolium medium]|uniref:F-box/RNI/FBD-like domain protein n=1 Tax=Trifolium medium TaxID=97028 RepID=A0A392M8M8_9FABA|nr:F-box/RNI/FBD-like domain protein [Trifolium medium]